MEDGHCVAHHPRRGERHHPGGAQRRADRGRDDLRDGLALLGLLQDDRQRRVRADRVRRVLPRRADLPVRDARSGSSWRGFGMRWRRARPREPRRATR